MKNFLNVVVLGLIIVAAYLYFQQTHENFDQSNDEEEYLDEQEYMEEQDDEIAEEHEQEEQGEEYIEDQGEKYIEEQGEEYIEDQGEKYIEEQGDEYMEEQDDEVAEEQGEEYLGDLDDEEMVGEEQEDSIDLLPYAIRNSKKIHSRRHMYNSSSSDVCCGKEKGVKIKYNGHNYEDSPRQNIPKISKCMKKKLRSNYVVDDEHAHDLSGPYVKCPVTYLDKTISFRNYTNYDGSQRKTTVDDVNELYADKTKMTKGNKKIKDMYDDVTCNMFGRAGCNRLKDINYFAGEHAYLNDKKGMRVYDSDNIIRPSDGTQCLDGICPFDPANGNAGNI